MGTPINIPKNKTILASKAAAMDVISKFILEDGAVRAVRYKEGEDVKTFLVLGTPNGVSIINDLSELESKIATLEGAVGGDSGILIWDEF